MNIDKALLFRLHPVSQGLSDRAVETIVRELELVECEPGDYVLRANATVDAVYLVVRGRLRGLIKDPTGNVLVERDIGIGQQVGAVAAALQEPSALECLAIEPSVLLKMEYLRGVELLRTIPDFRRNFVQLIAQSLKSAIFRDRHAVRPRSVGFFHQSAATRAISVRLFQRLADLEETPTVLTDQPPPATDPRIHYRNTADRSGLLEPEEILQAAAQALQVGRIFADIDAGADFERMVQAFSAFSLILWCVTPENWEASLPRLQAIQARSPSWRDKVIIVWLLAPGQDAPLAPALRELAHRDLKILAGEPVEHQGRAVTLGFERLVHILRGVQIGVALGGGAARGMAHLGVLKALEQHGIVVDMIAGTSAGAMTGTVYASGLDVDYSIDSFVHDLRPSWLFRHLPHGDQWFLLYKYRTRQFDPMLRKYLKQKCFEQLPVPMHAITVDLIGGRPLVRDRGDAVHGILESINLPVLSKPINRDGKSLVDGGLIDNVPADVLARNGCNFVIAVSVTAQMEPEFANNRPDTPTHQMRPASVVQTLLRSFLVQSVNINAVGVEPADIVIEPNVTQFELTEFTRTDELAAIGAATTESALGQIREQLHRLDPQLFPLVTG